MSGVARPYRSNGEAGEVLKIAAALAAALLLSGCSLSYSIFGEIPEEPLTTGSIAPKEAATPVLSRGLDEEDLRRARAALAVALDPQGPGTPVSWENPESGRKGVFEPAGAPFVARDEICRKFVVRLEGAAPASQSGSACRPSGGEWRLDSIAPQERGETSAPQARGAAYKG